ncbi:PAS domain S-box protein [Halobacillus sp. A5]|uniref:PAS domain S-box protein n=1 Tax=Halobacillus sp. A5 TaxID=2880263 RepID=UPI0020A6669A|nr:PAS domain S-box protein [Halobacillus sp. A5]MCP3026484.1 PAS domain S-box protein [Halobacillus sp. A5]
MTQTNTSLAIKEKEELFKQIIDYSFAPTIIHAEQKVLYINKAAEDFLLANKSELIGTSALGIFKEENKPYMRNRMAEIKESHQPGELIEISLIKADGSLVDVELTCTPVIFGETPAIQSVAHDITAHKLTASELDEVRHEIYEIATAIVPVSEGVSILPLTGRIDETRVNQLLDTIPLKLKDYDLDHLIIDFSGIYRLDETVVSFFYQINDIIRLLGIHPIFTGIRPELARKAVEIGRDLTDIDTIGTVKQAILKIKKSQ